MALWFRRASRQHTCCASLHKLLCTWCFFTVLETTLRSLGPLHISANGYKSEKSTNAIIISDVYHLLKSPNQDVIRVKRQTLIPPKPKSSVLVVSRTVDFQFIASKFLTGRKEQVSICRVLARILLILPFYVLLTNGSRNQYVYREDCGSAWLKIPNVNRAV